MPMSLTDIDRYVVFAPDVFYLRPIPHVPSQYPYMWGSTMRCVDTIYIIHTEVPADWCSDRVQFPVAPKGLDWLFVCIFTIIMCSKDQVILCPVQFCSRLLSVESVQVQWTHQIFESHSCPDSVSSNNIIFSCTWFSRTYTWSPCTISSYRQVGCTIGFNSRRYNISRTTLRDTV